MTLFLQPTNFSFMTPRSLTNYFAETPGMFENFFKSWNEWDDRGSNRNMSTIPAANISESKNDFRITLAAPGMNKENFLVEVDGNTLTIAQKRKTPRNKKKKGFREKNTTMLLSPEALHYRNSLTGRK